jgi:catechol 2,3-dioxygenase-like lactoylglutathione lyase family enzyme
MSCLVHISLLVDDYDRAIDYYCGILNFFLIEDTRIDQNKRWIRIAPQGACESSLLLAKASNDQQKSMIGKQGGGRVWLFLSTDDFWRDYHAWRAQGVCFIEEPRQEAYGLVVVFEDLYGNRWDLIQYHDVHKASVS